MRANTDSGIGSKACSESCSVQLRMQRWREEERKKILHVGTMLCGGAALQDIAGALGITLKNARAYVRKARELKPKEQKI